MRPPFRIALFWHAFLLMCIFTALCVLMVPVFVFTNDMPRLLGACLGAFCGACSSLLAYWVWEDATRDWLWVPHAPRRHSRRRGR